MHPSSLRYFLVAPLLVAAVACGGSGDAPRSADAGVSSSADGGGPSTSEEGAVHDGGVSAVGAEAGRMVDVHGTVTSYFDLPIAGRSVRVIDATGMQADVVTDSAGLFAVPAVVQPYDVRVSAEGLSDGASVYLGVSEPAPYLHAELAVARAKLVTQTFNLSVLLASACSGCGADFVSRSPHGGGGVTTTFPAGSSVVNAVLQHDFVSDGSPSEPVTLRLLVHDAARTWFRYAETSLTAVAGRTSPGGVYTPDLVPVHPLAVTVPSGGVPANWGAQASVMVLFPDGAAINVSDTRGQASFATNVPVIPGAALSAYAWLIDPIGDVDPTIGDDVQSWSGSLPSASTSVVLPAATPLHDVIPTPKSTIARTGPGISWTAPLATVTKLVLIDAHSHAVASVVTDRNTVRWERLAALGVNVAVGDLDLFLSTTPDTDLAAVVAGDATKRKVLSGAVAGSSSYQRWSFTLTP